MSIEIRNISKRFGNFVALDNINLDIPTGELVALLGPSGCGKTTLLRIIAGMETADQGEILFSGAEATHLHARERNVGFVFRCEGEPSILHPGDSLDAVAEGVDIALVPAFGPWAAMKETIEFARAVGAKQGFLIHEGLLNERGYGLISKHVGALSPTTLADVRDTRPWQP